MKRENFQKIIIPIKNLQKIQKKWAGLHKTLRNRDGMEKSANPKKLWKYRDFSWQVGNSPV